MKQQQRKRLQSTSTSSSSSSLTKESLNRISSTSSPESAARTDGGLGEASASPSSLDGDQMFHLLGGLDAHFLSQITDVIVSESAPEEVSIDATGEATADSVASGQPVHGDLLPPTSSSEDAEFLHAHPMVGSPTAKLESGEGDRGR